MISIHLSSFNPTAQPYKFWNSERYRTLSKISGAAAFLSLKLCVPPVLGPCTGQKSRNADAHRAPLVAARVDCAVRCFSSGFALSLPCSLLLSTCLRPTFPFSHDANRCGNIASAQVLPAHMGRMTPMAVGLKVNHVCV